MSLCLSIHVLFDTAQNESLVPAVNSFVMEILTVPARLRYWTSAMPEKIAFVFEHPQRDRVSLTFKDVTTLAGKFATRLQKLGIKKGDVVCSSLCNSPERVICDFGVMMTGAVTVPGHAVLADGSDVIHNLQVSKSKVLVVNPIEKAGVWSVVKTRFKLGPENRVHSDVFHNLKFVIFFSPDDNFLDSLLDEDDPEPVDLKPSDLATIFNTSGSTGISKLVATTHARIFKFCKVYAYMHNLDSTKTVYRDRPLDWSGGFPFFCIEGPSTQYLLDERFPLTGDIQGFIWKLICHEKIDTMFTTPPFLLSLLARGDLHIESDWMMETILVSGQCVETNLSSAIGNLCGKLGIAYGSTEACICTHQVYTNPSQVMDFSVGKVLPGCELLIADDDFQPVADGVPGQLIIKSESCFTDYYGNPEATKKAFTSDGWFCMDDTGFKDTNGEVFVQGRKSDLIMKGITKVFPGWLESQMLSSPLVNDVIVVPVPDNIFVNEICACVIPSREDVDAGAIQQLCESLFRTSSRETSAVPKYYMMMESFPCNKFGKTDKKALAKMAAQMAKTK